MPPARPTFTQSGAPSAPAAKTFAFLLLPRFAMLAFTAAVEPLRPANLLSGRTLYRWRALTADGKPMASSNGLEVNAQGDVEDEEAFDSVVVCGGLDAHLYKDKGAFAWLRRQARQGARVGAISDGTHVLAATGLLDGRRAATHWRYAEALARAHPAVRVDASVLYVEEGRVLTSAGSAAGIDLMLHIIRAEFGADAANAVARRLVVPAHRSGGQAQFVARPVARRPTSRLAPLLDRVRAEPARPWTVAAMAREAAMSERSFLRRFTEATGTSPGAWLAAVRVEEARRLLETTAAPVEEVARLAGFGSTANLRHHFRRAAGLSPREHRERFGHLRAAGARPASLIGPAR